MSPLRSGQRQDKVVRKCRHRPGEGAGAPGNPGNTGEARGRRAAADGCRSSSQRPRTARRRRRAAGPIDRGNQRMRRPARPTRSRALLLAGLVALSGAVTAQPAAAHGGIDHGSEPGADVALDWDNYEKILLTKDTGEPIDLAVMPDGKVLHTARDGVVRLTDPATGTTRVAATLDVYRNSEDGLQTVALDPNFAENGWVYLVYAPGGDGRRLQLRGALPEDDAGRQRAATACPPGRPRRTGTSGSATTSSRASSGTTRAARWTWAASRRSSRSRPSAGSAATSGRTSPSTPTATSTSPPGTTPPPARPAPTASRPNNDAPGMNPGLDARRGAGNTNDLRGKILRITRPGGRLVHHPRGQPLRPRAPRTPARRSTSWGCATPSASTTTSRPARWSGATTARTPASPTPSAARWATSSGSPPPSR